MTVATFNDTLLGVDVYDQGAVYVTVHDSTGGATGSASTVTIGQLLLGSTYDIRRSGVFFNTSTLGAGVAITAAVLKLKPFERDITDGDFDVTIVSGTDLQDPMVDTDYYQLLDETTSYGALAASSFTLDSFNNVTLNASGLAAINKTGTTQLGLRSSRDISTTAPTGVEYISFHPHDWYWPDPSAQLVVTYTSGFIPKIFYF